MDNIVLAKDKVLQFLNYKKNQDISSFEDVIKDCISEITKISQIKYLINKQRIESVSDETIALDNGLLFEGKAINKHLQGCNFAVITISTIGYEADKKILALQSISPSKSLILNAAASAMAETITDRLYEKLIKEYGKKYLTPRFSPGYKDLPLKTNKDIIDKYNLTKKFGIMINDSYLMSPSKTITAITGIRGE